MINEGADQLRSNCKADKRLCFRYIDSTIPLVSSHLNLNLNDFLVIRQIDNNSPGVRQPGSHKRCESSDISAEEIRESGRSFQSLIVCGKKLLLYASLLAEGI